METLIKKISLSPKDLDTNTEERIYNKAVTLLKDSCTKKNGYIIDIDRNIKILDNEISTGGLITFIVELNVQTFKPVENQELEGIVCVVFEEGLFVEVQYKMKVLVPKNKLENYVFDKNNGGIFQKGKKIIKKGDIVTVKIEQIKYDNKGFNCIGDLKIRH